MPKTKLAEMLTSLCKFLASFYRSTMACLFNWLRIRVVRARPSSPPISQPNTESAVSKNRKRLKQSPVSQEGSDGSPGTEERCNLLDSPIQDPDFEGLRDEAKFLKACGTILVTPADIHKPSIMLNNLSPSGFSDSSEFDLLLPNTSPQNLNLEMEPDHDCTPNKQCKDWVTCSASSAHDPNSCIRNGQMIFTSAEESDVDKVDTSVHVFTGETTSVHSRNKSVRFNCPSGTSLSSLGSSSSGSYNHSIEKSESPDDERTSKLSPNPTPLKLSDDMQTPGTVFPSYIGKIVVGKNPRIRTQYVQAVGNEIEDFSHLRGLRNHESNPDQQSAHLIKPSEQANISTTDSEEEMKVEPSLSSCMKPLPSNQCANNQWVVNFNSEDTYFGHNPGDQPIFGTVAAHWNEDNSSLRSLKSWDGNGIPNSTTKYKEDQKVSWHATPFEERLEKALSEKHVISQRRNLFNATPCQDWN
ncbi:hypothetical protein ACET3Z_009989 [Daucus carota]